MFLVIKKWWCSRSQIVFTWANIEPSPILKPLYLQGEKVFFVLYLQEQTICLLHVQTRFQDLVGIILAIICHISQSFCHSLCEKCPYSVLFRSSFSAFGKCGPEQLQIRTLYATIIISQFSAADEISQVSGYLFWEVKHFAIFLQNRWKLVIEFSSFVFYFAWIPYCVLP